MAFHIWPKMVTLTANIFLAEVKMNLRHTGHVALILAAGLMAVPAMGIAEGAAPTITVSGEGRVTAPADMATIRIGVQHEGATTAEALDATSVATAAILEALETAGIKRDDMRTTGVGLVPRYGANVLGNIDYSKIEGYTSTNSIAVDVYDLSLLGGLLADAVEAGANTIDGVTFGLADHEALVDQARIDAVNKAKHAAEVYAQAAGESLGSVMSMTEMGGGGFYAVMSEPMMRSDEAAVKYDVPLAPSNIDVTASVSIVWALAE